MRETFTGLFCVLAMLALVFGKIAATPNLATAYTAYQSALERGDMHRAARYGELTLAAAATSQLFDDAGRARLAAMVATAQAKAGNPERARALYQQAITGFGDGVHAQEAAAAKSQLAALDRIIAERTLKASVTPSPLSAHSGG